MKKYLIPASITAVAVGAFLVFQNAGYVQTVQLSTWRPVADLTAWPGTTVKAETLQKIWPGMGAGMISLIPEGFVGGEADNLDPPKNPKSFEHCEYRIKYKAIMSLDSYLYPTMMEGFYFNYLKLQFSTVNGSPFDFFKPGQSKEYPKILELHFYHNLPKLRVLARLIDLSPPPAPKPGKGGIIITVTPKNPVELGENIESVILESRCYMRHRSSVLDDETKSVVGAKIGNES